METYPQFQGPNPEWTKLQQLTAFPAVMTAPEETAKSLREKTNTFRVNMSESDVEAEELRDKVNHRDWSVPTRDKQNIIARVYRPSSVAEDTILPAYIFFHGGGFLFGNVESEDAACSRMVAGFPAAGIAVISVNYRHTPEFQHPTQINDAWDAFLWVAENTAMLSCDPQRLMVGGISAGAGLAAYVVQRHQGLPQSHVEVRNASIQGQILCVPWLIHPPNHPSRHLETSSYKQNVDAPILPLSLLNMFTELLGVEDASDPTINPALADNKKLSILPKAVFLVAGQDLLRDEGLFYAKRLKQQGVATKVHVFPGLPHAFRRYSALPSSRRWDQLATEALEWCLSQDKTCSFNVEHGSEEK